MFDRRDQIPERWRFARGTDDEELEFVRELAEHLPPPSRRDPISQLANTGSDRSKQCPTREQGQDRRVDQGYDDVFLLAVNVVESISRLELLEDELDLPASAIGSGDVFGREQLDRNARQVAMVLPLFGITDSNEPKSLDGRTALAIVATRLRPDFDLDIDQVASEADEDVLQRLADESLVVGRGSLEDSHDLRICVLLEARQEVPSRSNDVPEELEVVVAEVEEQELALDPVVDDELSAIVDPTVGQLDTGPPAALDAHNGVELGGRWSRVRPAAWEQLRESVVEFDHGRVGDQDVLEGVEAIAECLECNRNSPSACSTAALRKTTSRALNRS